MARRSARSAAVGAPEGVDGRGEAGFFGWSGMADKVGKRDETGKNSFKTAP